MAETTGISWADHTWSPWRGCTKVSPGCTNCYAEALSCRNPAVLGEWGPNGTRVVNADWEKPRRWDRAAKKAGERRRVFPSLCDPFEDREDLGRPLADFLRLIDETPNLDWLVLTKRPENVRKRLRAAIDTMPKRDEHAGARWNVVDWLQGGEPSGRPYPPNLWLGVSVENQEYADQRIPVLLNTPAAVRWFSVEPLLGPIDLTKHWHTTHNWHNWLTGETGIGRTTDNLVSHKQTGQKIDWVVIGGESGPNHRPCQIEWIEAIADQCVRAGVACFVKQDSGRFPGQQGRISDDLWALKEFPRHINA
jgi:protein gp37